MVRPDGASRARWPRQRHPVGSKEVVVHVGQEQLSTFLRLGQAIVTNRPVIANSWFDDFTRFIGHQTTYRFVSESPSLASRP